MMESVASEQLLTESPAAPNHDDQVELEQQLSEDIVFDDQPATSKDVKISLQLYERLTQTYCLLGGIGQEPIVDQDEMVALPEHQKAEYLNGYTFARYMIALKVLVKQRQNQDLNFDFSKLLKIMPQISDPLHNWKVIQKELDKTGITIDDEVFSLLCIGDTESINKLYLRLERYMKILCGPLFLNFQDSENVFETLKIPQDEHNNVQETRSSQDSKLQERFKSISLEKAVEAQPPQATEEMLTELHDSFETEDAQLPSNIQQVVVDQSPTGGNERKKNNQVYSRVVTDGVDIVTIQTDRNLNYCQNSLEFLLITLSRAFDLTPRQSAALLTNNNQYLVTACIKGIKGGNYLPVLTWYRELQSNVLILAELLQAEYNQFNDAQSIHKVFATISAGLYSQNSDVANQTLLLLIECFTLFHNSFIEVAFSWFLSSEEGGLKRAILCLQQQGGDTPFYFTQLCNVMCTVPEQLMVLYKDEVQNHCQTQWQYLQIVIEVVGWLKRTKEDAAVESGLVDYWLDLTAREAENDGMHTQQERITALALMTEVWLHFSDHVGEVEDCANTIIFMLKRACREQSRMIKLTTAGMLFKLLDSFSRTRNVSAPLIYKTLVFNIVESPGDLTLREFYFTNFTELFRSQPGIPIGLFLEPLIKQIQTQINITYFLKTFDYDFFSFISTHPKLNIDLALSLMDLLSKLCLGEVDHCAAVAPSYHRIVMRYQDELRIQNQVQEFIEFALQQLYDIEQSSHQQKDQSKFQQRRSASRYNNQNPSKPNASANQDQKTILTYKKHIIFTLLFKFQNIPNDTIQQNLCEQLRDTQQKMIQSFDSNVLGATVVDQLLQKYGPSEMIVPRVASELKRSQSREAVQRAGDTDALMPFSEKQSVAIRKKVMGDIERIRKQKEDKEHAKRQEEEQKAKLQDRRKTSLKRQIERRRIELGVAGSHNTSTTTKAILQSAVETPELKTGQIQVLVQWIELDDEEDVDRQAAHLFMRKYAKLWRNIFSKYANAGYKVLPLNDRGSFEGLNKASESITLAEIMKMCKDHNLFPSLLSKDDISQIFRFVNLKANMPIQPLDFPKFLTFLTQAALNAYKPYQAPLKKLRLMLSLFEQATRQKGLSTFLYEDQDQPESDTIQQLNKKLLEDASYPLPENFTKVKERIQLQTYKLSDTVAEYLSEASQIALALVDELLESLFGFHVLEPYTTFEEQIKVRSVISRPLPRPEPQPQNKGSGSSARPRKLQPLVTDKEPQATLVAAVEQQCQDKELAIYLAKILESMISIATAQETAKNVALQTKIEQEQQKREIEKLREQKRKERDQKVKQDLERLKVEKAERDEKLAAEKEEQERQAKINEKKRREAARKAIEQMMVQDARARETRQSQKDAQSQQAAASKKPPVKATKEQIARQLQSHQDLMNKLSAQNSQLHLKEEEAKSKELELRDQIKKKSEQLLAQNRLSRVKESVFSQELQDFMASEPVTQVFNSYDRFLNYMFKFYCKQAKVDISKELTKNSLMALKEFSKFGYQTKVVPVLLTADEMITLFRVVLKQHSTSAQALYNKQAGQESAQMLDYDTFKQALVRICILAHDKIDQDASKTDSVRLEQQRVKEIITRREMDKKSLQQQVLLEMRSEFESKKEKQAQALSRSPSQQKLKGKLTTSASDSNLQDADFQRWLKQQESLGNGLQKRVEQRVNRSLDTTRAVGSKQSKLQSKIDLIDRMSRVDIRDNRSVQREMNINLVSAQSVERLLRFVGLVAGAEISLAQMNQILNAQRIENSGSKPQSQIKRLMLPQLAMGTIQENDEEQRLKETQNSIKLNERYQENDAPQLALNAADNLVSESHDFGLYQTSPRNDQNSGAEGQIGDDEVKVRDQNDSAAEAHITRQVQKEKPNIVEEPQSQVESHLVADQLQESVEPVAVQAQIVGQETSSIGGGGAQAVAVVAPGEDEKEEQTVGEGQGE